MRLISSPNQHKNQEEEEQAISVPENKQITYILNLIDINNKKSKTNLHRRGMGPVALLAYLLTILGGKWLKDKNNKNF
jgi:hypothetical protein